MESTQKAIDEAKMQISNAGTNGQVLSKQSRNTGGLTNFLCHDLEIASQSKILR